MLAWLCIASTCYPCTCCLHLFSWHSIIDFLYSGESCILIWAYLFTCISFFPIKLLNFTAHLLLKFFFLHRKCDGPEKLWPKTNFPFCNEQFTSTSWVQGSQRNQEAGIIFHTLQKRCMLGTLWNLPCEVDGTLTVTHSRFSPFLDPQAFLS